MEEGFWLPEFDELAQYNADKDRYNNKYTVEYREKMKALQKKYNARMRESLERKGYAYI